jgi:hypothetical protein
MYEDFRKSANEELAQLLIHWQKIELWIKRAEQVNGRAVIPAINELRYASRQIFNAMKLLQSDSLNDGTCNVIRKRLNIAEQYLLNADHDICDAVVGFYDEVIKNLDEKYGISQIAILYPLYPLVRTTVHTSRELIAGARADYEKRRQHYEDLRTTHIPSLIKSYSSIVDAEVAAKQEKSVIETALRRANTKVTVLSWFGLFASIVGIIAVPLSIYLWLYTPVEFCKKYGSTWGFQVVCSLSATPESAANNPSTVAKPGAPARH